MSKNGSFRRKASRNDNRILQNQHKSGDGHDLVQLKNTISKPFWKVNNVFLTIESEHEHSSRIVAINWKQEFSCKFLWLSFLGFWKKLKTRLRNFFIESHQIAPYRWEWRKKYQNWNYRAPLKRNKTLPERTKFNQARRRSKIVNILKSRGDPRIQHSGALCETIEINVSGTIFHAQERTLRQFPNSLLGNPAKRIRYFDPCSNQYFFERNATSFAEILNWYQRCGKRLTRPSKIPVSIFERELKFFGLPYSVIKTYRDEEEGQEPEPEKILPRNLLKRKYWMLFEYPESSKQAKMIVFGSVCAIILTIFCFCIETLSVFNDKDIETVIVTNSFRDPFFISETVCIIWFTYETLVRFLCCPNKLVHSTNLLNILDVISILPYYIQTIIVHGIKSDTSKIQHSTRILQILRVTRVFRVIRIFKLSRHSTSFRILGRTLNASRQELMLLTFLMIVAMTMFATAAFYADYGRESFTSIPDAFWWALNTLTTVGYGDLVPVSPGGKVIGIIACIAGILYVALPVPVIVANFNYYYARFNDANDLEVERRVLKSHHQEECEFRPTCGPNQQYFQMKKFDSGDREIYREQLVRRAMEKKMFRKDLRKTLELPAESSSEASQFNSTVKDKLQQSSVPYFNFTGNKKKDVSKVPKSKSADDINAANIKTKQTKH